MDGKPTRYTNMGTPANLYHKKRQQNIHTIIDRTQAKTKKWNNYTTKIKTTHHNPKKQQINAYELLTIQKTIHK